MPGPSGGGSPPNDGIGAWTALEHGRRHAELSAFIANRATARAQKAAKEGWALARYCKASGRGLHLAITRKENSFTIHAFDAENKPRDTGGDPFMVAIRGKDMVRARVHDNNDGTYTVRYKTYVSGTYAVSLSLHGVALPGSPFLLKVLGEMPDPKRCRVKGAGLRKAVAREPSCFEIEFLDAFGAITHAEELDCFVERIALRVDAGEDAGVPSLVGRYAPSFEPWNHGGIPALKCGALPAGGDAWAM